MPVKEGIRRRPGMPRKQGTVKRITLRISNALAKQMNAACEADDVTQREFVEEAVKAYCAGPIKGEAEAQKNDDVYRTGMWIDPSIVRLMDEREQREGIFQRTLLERAIADHVKRRAGRA
jgi:hypothetical protein